METQIQHPHFGLANYTVIGLYLAGMLLVGGLISRRIRTTSAFFVAEGKLGFVVVGLSLLGTYLSALTMMGLPGAAFGKFDMLWSIQLPFLIITGFVITRFVLPRYREAGVISVYQYLEQRIHISSRLIASFCFLMLQIGRMGLVLFLPALAFHIVTGAPLLWTIVVMGVVVTLYTVMGGIEAVMWTDAVQVIILATGALLSLIYVFVDVSAAGADFLAIANAHHKLRMVDWGEGLSFGEYFTKFLTVWLILQTIFETIRIYGTQQDMTQRYVTARSTREANKSVWLAILGYIPLGYLFYFMGAAMFVYYQVVRDDNVPKLLEMGRADAVYPYFVVTKLPAGVAGLVIAAIFAAAMSSIDSGMNSASTVCIEDFYKRWHTYRNRVKSDQHYLAVARWLTFAWGALAIAMAILMINIKYAQVAWTEVMALSTNGVLGLMALAFLPFRIRWSAAIIGFVACYAIVLYMKFCTPINVLIWPVAGNLVCFFVALLVNPLLRAGFARSGPTEANDRS